MWVSSCRAAWQFYNNSCSSNMTADICEFKRFFWVKGLGDQGHFPKSMFLLNKKYSRLSRCSAASVPPPWFVWGGPVKVGAMLLFSWNKEFSLGESSPVIDFIETFYFLLLCLNALRDKADTVLCLLKFNSLALLSILTLCYQKITFKELFFMVPIVLNGN